MKKVLLRITSALLAALIAAESISTEAFADFAYNPIRLGEAYSADATTLIVTSETVLCDSEDYKQIIVKSGKLTLEPEFSFSGTLIVENNAAVDNNGQLDGDVIINATEASDYYTDWDGSLARANNLTNNGTINYLTVTGDCFMANGGVINTFEISGDGSGEFINWDNGKVNTYKQNANYTTFNTGTIETAEICRGDLHCYGYSRINFVNLKDKGKLFNFPEEGSGENKVPIIDVLFEEGDEAYVSNQGVIDYAILHGSSFDSNGHIGALHATMNSSANITPCDTEVVKAMYDNDIDYVYIDGDCSVNIWSDSDEVRIGAMEVWHGSFNVEKAYIDYLYLFGDIGRARLNNIKIGELYCDASPEYVEGMFDVPNPETVNAAEIVLSRNFFENAYDIAAELLGLPPKDALEDDPSYGLLFKVEDKENGFDSTTNATKISLDEYPEATNDTGAVSVPNDFFVQVNGSEEMWFKFNVKSSLGFDMTLTSYSTMTTVTIYTPDGQILTFSANDETKSITALEKSYGDVLCCVKGAYCGADISIDSSSAVLVDFAAYYRDSVSESEIRSVYNSLPVLARQADLSGEVRQSSFSSNEPFSGVLPLSSETESFSSLSGEDSETRVYNWDGTEKYYNSFNSFYDDYLRLYTYSVYPQEYKLEIFDETQGEVVNRRNYRLDGRSLYLSPKLNGHTLTYNVTPYYYDTETPCGYHPASTTVVNDESFDSTFIELYCLGFGEYRGYVKDASAVKVYIYDETGTFVTALTPEDGIFNAGRLKTGEYRAVFIRDAMSKYSFFKYSDFRKAGLSEKLDYVTDVFNAEPGVVETYTDVEVPEAPAMDDSMFDMQKTGVYSTKSSTFIGDNIPFYFRYSFDERYTERVSSIRIEFTVSGGDYIPGSAAVNGNKIEETVSDNTISFSLEEKTDVTSAIYVSSLNSAKNVTVIGTISFMLDGELYELPMGSVCVSVVNLLINGPSVSTSVVTLTGIATPSSKVTILDGEEIIGTCKSSSRGYWSVDATLSDSNENAVHSVRAALNYESVSPTYSDILSITYNSATPVLQNFTFKYKVHGHSAKLSLSGSDFGKRPFTYEYWPGSIFTFNLEFSNDSAIKQLYVVSTNGGYYPLEAFYDEAADVWTACGIFSEDENYIPGDFEIRYTDNVYSLDTIIDKLGSYTVAPLEINKEKLEAFSDGAKYSDAVTTEENGSFTETTTIDLDGVNVGLETTSAVKLYDLTEDDLVAQGYEVNEGENGSVFYTRMTFDYETMSSEYEVISPYKDGDSDIAPLMNSSIERVTVNMDGKALLSSSIAKIVGFSASKIIKASVKNTKSPLLKKMAAETERMSKNGKNNFFGKLYDIGSDIKDVISDGREIIDTVKNLDELDLEELSAELQNMKASYDVITYYCLNGSMASHTETLTDGSITELIDAAKAKAQMIQLARISYAATGAAISFALEAGITYGLTAAFSAATGGVASVPGYIISNIASSMITKAIMDRLDDSYKSTEDKLINDLKNDMAKAKEKMSNLKTQYDGDPSKPCSCTENCPDDKPKKIGGNETNEQLDPSGYVYEAVRSNRIEGVTATCYYQDEDGNVVLWDAEEYDQINPLTTDENGAYMWMVPQGLWKVTYLHNGYENAESDFLPVPPPQMDVNQAMISYDVPDVETAVLYSQYVDVKFTKYMKVDEMNGAFTLDGNEGAVSALNSEESDDGTLLADTFRITCPISIPVGATATLRISGKAISYAGIPMEGYERTLTCIPTVTGLSVDPPTYLHNGSTSELMVKIEGDGDLSALKLNAISDSDALKIIGITDSDAGGNTKLTLSAESVDTAQITIFVEGTMLSESFVIASVSQNQTALISYLDSTPSSSDFAPIWQIFILCGAVVLIVAFVMVIFLRKKSKKSQTTT